MSNELTLLTQATTMLAEARTLEDIKEIRNMAAMAEAYAKAESLGREAQDYAAEIRLLAGRKAGEVLIQAKEAGEIRQGPRAKSSEEELFSLEELEISKKQSRDWQAMAKVDEEKFQEVVDHAKNKGVTSDRAVADLIRKPHVSHNSGQNEWYTPEPYIEAARLAMGSIDLDPASSAKANEVVKAAQYFTAEDDGLRQAWHGNVWMNPPYAQPLIAKFADKLRAETENGNIMQFCVLVNNATETRWFRDIAGCASLICFPSGRVRFWMDGGEIGAPLQGQAILYYGDRESAFWDHFNTMGLVVIVQRLRRRMPAIKMLSSG